MQSVDLTGWSYDELSNRYGGLSDLERRMESELRRLPIGSLQGEIIARRLPEIRRLREQARRACHSHPDAPPQG